ncbi:MAG: hypothetical protein K0S38_691 [Candidatus Paceibacter sp.]|nr:hypothetical protein [Candidatus Paceibacter sp.]
MAEKKDKGFAGFTTEPVKNFMDLIGKNHAKKLAEIYSDLPEAARMAHALDLLKKKFDRDLIKSRIGLEGPIPTYQAIADANRISKAALYERYTAVIRRLKKAIDSLTGS